MFTDMELWSEIRRRVLGGELSKRAACREYSVHWDTLKKILEHVEPPGYRQAISRTRPTIHLQLLDPSPFGPLMPFRHVAFSPPSAPFYWRASPGRTDHGPH